MFKKQSSKTETLPLGTHPKRMELYSPLLERSNQVLHSQYFGLEYI
jgi:hypothetical protein